MELLDVLADMGGLQSMARELGVSENTARAGAAQLLPVILGGLKKKTQSQPAEFAAQSLEFGTESMPS